MRGQILETLTAVNDGVDELLYEGAIVQTS